MKYTTPTTHCMQITINTVICASEPVTPPTPKIVSTGANLTYGGRNTLITNAR